MAVCCRKSSEHWNLKKVLLIFQSETENDRIIGFRFWLILFNSVGEKFLRKSLVFIITATSILLSGCYSNLVKAEEQVSSPSPQPSIDSTILDQSLEETITTQPTLPAFTQTEESTLVPPPTSEANELIELTPDPSVKTSPVPTDENGLPISHYIYGITGHKQYFPLGCEAAVTRDWALYFGMDINEFEFQHKLPLSDNPEVGFVGSVTSKWGQAPPYAYGVHAGPVAQLLQEYGLPATAVKNYSLTLLKQQIAADRPVIAWVIGNVVGGIPYEYTAKDGQKVTVAAYEHVVIVTGYNETHIRYVNNGKFFEAPIKVFLNSWKVLGNMALIAGA
jgi:uncharacterized protein YvpB